jgi:hypothetical protein
MDTRSMETPTARRTALLLEAIPLGAAAVLGLVILVVFATTPDDGWHDELEGLPPVVETLVTLPFALVAMLAGISVLAFLVSGVGWITAGRASVGAPLMIVRFFISMFIAVPLGPSDGGLLPYLPGFAFSLGVAALSVIMLARSLRSGSSSVRAA